MNIFTKTKNTIMSSKVTKAGPVGSESIDDMGKGAVSGDVVLLADEYTHFWTGICQDRQSCARYMARIVVTLLNFEQDLPKAEKTVANKSAIASSDHMVNLLLNTAQFIDMFIGFDPKNEAFVSAMDKFELAKKATPTFKSKKIHDGLLDLSKRRAHRGLAAVKMIVECSSLSSDEEIIHCSMQDGSSNYLRLANSMRSTGIDDLENSALERATVEFPFTFIGLSRMTKADFSPMIFDELLKQLEGAGSALSSMAHMQGRTLALMFMLREFLTISPTADHMWMQRACLVLMGLYKWPKPYGRVAKELLDFLFLERRSPGCHLRERLFEGSPFLHPIVMLRNLNIAYTPLHPQDKNDGLESYFTPVSKTCPVSFVFLDNSVPLCCTHKHLLCQSTNIASPTSATSTPHTSFSSSTSKISSSAKSSMSVDDISLQQDMRISIISNAFDTDFVIFPVVEAKSKNKVKDPLNLKALSDEDITVLYCQVLEILERAKTLPVNAGSGGERTDKDTSGMPYTIPGGLSKLYRESLLGSLLQRLHPDKIFAPRRSSDEKVKHIIRQSRRTSLIQQESISDRKSTIDENVVDAQSEMIAQARLESKRLAQVLSPDEMAMLEGDSDDEEKENEKTVFNASENTVHDTILFGQHAPLIPEGRLEVVDVKKQRRAVGEDVVSMTKLSSSPTKEDYAYSTNASGYLHIKQDVDDLVAVIEKAKQEWINSYGHSEVDSDDISSTIKRMNLENKIDVRVDSTDENNRIKIKIVLMGSNLVIHRFLSAYVALHTGNFPSLSEFSFEIYVVPQGRNHLGIFLARSDKWYRRHIFDSFKGPLGICPQYSTKREQTLGDLEGLNMHSCLPVKNLRQLFFNYIRQATQKFPFAVFECLCWAVHEEDGSIKKTSSTLADDSANDMNVFNKKSTPDIIIPFLMQIQLGLFAQLEQFREKPSSLSKLEKHNDKRPSVHSHHEKAMLSMRECFADKDAIFGGIDLSLQYLPSSITAPSGNTSKVVNQNAPSPSTIQVDTFSTLSVNNFPCHDTSRDDYSKRKVNTVTMPSEQLVMESQLCKGSCADLLNNRRKNAKSMENFLESLNDKSTFEHPQHIEAIEINVTNPSDSFHILVDGTLYGPFRRLIVRSCSTGDDNKTVSGAPSSEGLTIPIMTYMPLHQ